MASLQEHRLASDGLPALVQGPWSKDKIHFVSYFSDLFNGGMKNLWPKRIYVDLFSGPGICIDRTTGEEFEGSALRALRCSTPFTQLFFNDINKRFVDALRQRQERQYPDADVVYENLDCNLAARSLAKAWPQDALALIFIDPWTYEIAFEGICSLAQRRFTDLIVTFQTGAIKRNVHQQVSKVDKFLGDPKWRRRYWKAEGDPSNPPTAVLLEILRERLRETLSYTHFGNPAIIRYATGTPAYYLLFASRNDRGMDFWEKTRTRSRHGQRAMF